MERDDQVAAKAEPASSVVWEWQARATSAARDRAAQAAAARREGWIGGVIGLLVAAGIALVFHRRGLAEVVAAVAVATTLLALVSPLTLFGRLRRLLERLGHGIGTVVTWLLMTLLFYLLFLPVGLLLRATGKLAFTRSGDPRLRSYWNASDKGERAAASYRKQF